MVHVREPAWFIAAGPISSIIEPYQRMVISGDYLYFWASDDSYALNLWRSDGTATGTIRITNIGNENQSTGAVAAIGTDGAIFTDRYATTLLLTDGSIEGTSVVASLNGIDSLTFDHMAHREVSSISPEPANCGARTARQPEPPPRGADRELWRTDRRPGRIWYGTSTKGSTTRSARTSAPAIFPSAADVRFFSRPQSMAVFMRTDYGARRVPSLGTKKATATHSRGVGRFWM